MNQQLSSTNLFSRWSVLAMLFLVLCMITLYLSKQSFQQQTHVLKWEPLVQHNTTDDALTRKFSRGDSTDYDNKTRLEPHRNAVVIVTQGRSGSTLLGNTIRLDQNVFYVFEPLHYLIYNHQNLNYADGTKRQTRNYLYEAYQTVISLLTCNITGLPLEFFDSWANVTNFQVNQLMSFYKQFKNSSELSNVKKSPSVFRSKLSPLEKLCLESSTVAIKTIRLPLFVVTEMFSKIENLKIILLIRDPRPVVASQSAIFFKGAPSLIKTLSQRVCLQMSLDISTYNVLNCSYSSKLKLLKYENFVSDIYNETQMLYRFLNLNYSTAVINGIHNMTTTGNSANTYSSYRKNSKQLVYLWRETIAFNVTQTIDSMCAHAYSMAGYCLVEDESDLKNMTLPLYGEMCRSNITDGIICPTGKIQP